MAEVVPIPEPPRLPLIGHLAEFSAEPIKDLIRLADTYGSIYQLQLGKGSNVFVSSQALVNEISDERRFKKSLGTALGEVRHGVHDGLFTAHDEEPNWAKAHRILVPAFGPLSIRGMFDEMHDIASQLCMKWARHGPQTPINASDDFTRLALDTIALCAMDYRFNSFYHEEMHPFIAAMGDFLAECGVRNRRPAIVPDFMYRAANNKFWADIAVMRDTADAVVEARKATPNNRKDLLTAMLNGVDPQDDTKLDDANITDQLITFLIAGHETTSALLSFTMYNLLKHPEAYQKVQQEVDDVVGREPVRVEHVSKLPYIAAVLRESLRVSPSIVAFSVEAKEDTLLAGKYLIPKAQPVTALIACSHVDPAVFGDDATQFKPERMLDDNFNRLNKEFPNCWKPFGNGKRSCIGRPFAWQEALLCVAMLFQNFTFSLDDPNYNLKIKQSLTVKPKDFFMRASLRHNMTPTELESRIAGKFIPEPAHLEKRLTSLSLKSTGKKPMAVFYGSNSGTCEALAQRVAADAANRGFDVTELAPLDAATGKLPKDLPVIIVTSSYEGQAPSNAARFVTWIDSLKGKELEGVSYAVFGCGHHDWTRTFHRIPKLVDSTLCELGGDRLVPMAATDVADRDIFSDFEAWEDESLWPALDAKYGAPEEADAAGGSGGLTVEVSQPRKTTLRQDVEEALVISARTLADSDTSKKQIEIQLPTDMSYRAGDYLAILPINPKASVSRVFRRFNLSWDAFLKIDSTQPTALPTRQALPAADVLGAYVELNQPATKRNILALAEATEDAEAARELERLAGDAYRQEITVKRISVLDLLEKFSSTRLPLAAFLAMLPPIRVRQYSISSSPLADPTKVTLTYSVLERPHFHGQGQHLGVSSNFLSSLTAGDRLHVAVRPSIAFRLPSDAENTPLICVAAGSGVAPFRGFIQERAAMIAAGRHLAPALLFFGCRSPGAEDLYADDFARWESLGAVTVRRAYSRASDQSLGCKYVQHRLLHDSEDVSKLWNEGAKIYVCGSEQLGKAVEKACAQIVVETRKRETGEECSLEEARIWFKEHRKERYTTDVFD